MRILVIPDTQVKSGVPTNHLSSLGEYIVAKQPEVIVHLGDHFDMPSLSSYDKKGSKSFEGRRYMSDIDSGKDAMQELVNPIIAYNQNQTRNKKRQYKPRMVFLLGNHEARVDRAVEDDPKLDGVIGRQDFNLQSYGWEVYPYMEVVDIEGILFSHVFVNTSSLLKNVLGGTIDNKLKAIGQSFVMGHQQQLQFGNRYLNCGKQHIGIVAGAFYQHDEDYMGPQGNHHWRGCIMLNEVKDGAADPMFLSLNYFLRRNHGT